MYINLLFAIVHLEMFEKGKIQSILKFELCFSNSRVGNKNIV
jgi:hypothetical protein